MPERVLEMSALGESRLRVEGSPAVGGATDHHARIAFEAMHPNEKMHDAVAFLHDAMAYCAGLDARRQTAADRQRRGLPIQGVCCGSQGLGVQHRFIKPCPPQIHDKAGRFIRSVLREWAYGWTYQNSAHRIHPLVREPHRYNWHRPHCAVAKNSVECPMPAVTDDYVLRGSPARAAARQELDHDAARSIGSQPDRSARAMPSLRRIGRKTALVTQ